MPTNLTRINDPWTSVDMVLPVNDHNLIMTPLIFILVIAEKESQIKRRNDTLMKKETDLETFAKVLTGKENLMFDYEKSLSDRAKNLEYKEKQYGVQLGHTGMLME